MIPGNWPTTTFKRAMSVTDLLIKMKPKKRSHDASPLLERNVGALGVNKRRLRHISMAVGLVSFAMLLVLFKFWNHLHLITDRIPVPNISQQPLKQNNNTKPKKVVEPTFRVELQLSDDPSKFLHKPNTLMDTCRIMPQCFSHSKSFGDLTKCQETVDLTMRHYDSGLLIETSPDGVEEVVGFLSALPVRRQNHIFIFFYNVCIDSSRRRKGLAKKLLTDFVDKYVGITNWPRDRIFLALDVDLRTPVAVGALSLYLKLGYVRWIEPCKSVAENDVSNVINPPYRQRPLENLAAIFTDPKGYAKKSYKKYDPSSPEHSAKGPHPTHFCMYKKLTESFDDIGRALVETVADLDKRFPNMVVVDDD